VRREGRGGRRGKGWDADGRHTAEGDVSGEHGAKGNCPVVPNVTVAVEHENLEGAPLVGEEARQGYCGRVVQAAPRNGDLANALTDNDAAKLLYLERAELPVCLVSNERSRQKHIFLSRTSHALSSISSTDSTLFRAILNCDMNCVFMLSRVNRLGFWPLRDSVMSELPLSLKLFPSTQVCPSRSSNSNSGS
jgi:hypothetical protein